MNSHLAYLGIDVAKLTIDCCLLLPSAPNPRHEKERRKGKSFCNTETGILSLVAWLKKQELELENIHAIMEGTGAYHFLTALILSHKGLIVSVANPMQVKNFGKGLGVKTKTDSMDSYVIAKYGMTKNPSAWRVPSDEVRALLILIKRCDAIKEDIQREKNRKEKLMFANEIIGKSVNASIDEGIAFLGKQLAKLEKEVSELIKKTPGMKEDVELLKTIHCVGDVIAVSIMSLTHEHEFHSAEQLAAYLGTVPVERTSGTSVRGKPRMSKVGPSKIRASLYMGAMNAIRFNAHCKNTYERLLGKGKSKMCALGAVMRKLVHLCFGVLKTRKAYDPNYAVS